MLEKLLIDRTINHQLCAMRKKQRETDFAAQLDLTKAIDICRGMEYAHQQILAMTSIECAGEELHENKVNSRACLPQASASVVSRHILLLDLGEK